MAQDDDPMTVRALNDLDPPPCPGAYLTSDRAYEGVQHAQPGDEAPTLCGLPADSVTMVRNLFSGHAPNDCPECARRLWTLPPRRPRQAAPRWGEAVNNCHVVLVVAGPSFNPARRRDHQILVRVESGPVLDKLRTVLAVDPNDDDCAWTASGVLTLALYARDRELLATVTLLGDGWLRTALLAGDQRVADPDALADWLARHVPAAD